MYLRTTFAEATDVGKARVREKGDRLGDFPSTPCTRAALFLVIAKNDKYTRAACNDGDTG